MHIVYRRVLADSELAGRLVRLTERFEALAGLDADAPEVDALVADAADVGDAGDGLLAVGDANVTIDLDPAQLISPTGAGRPVSLGSLRITADDPAGFVAGILARRKPLLAAGNRT